MAGTCDPWLLIIKSMDMSGADPGPLSLQRCSELPQSPWREGWACRVWPCSPRARALWSLPSLGVNPSHLEEVPPFFSVQEYPLNLGDSRRREHRLLAEMVGLSPDPFGLMDINMIFPPSPRLSFQSSGRGPAPCPVLGMKVSGSGLLPFCTPRL